jgi:hypothetical protein
MKFLARVVPESGSLHKGVVLTLVVALLATLLLPSPARGQLGLGLAGLVKLLQSVYDIIRDELGELLGQIRTLTQWFNEYYQLVLFPKNAIDAAKAFVDWMRATFNALISQVLRFPVHSATLPAPQQLENLIRGGSLDFGQMASAYRSVYGAVPAAGDASPLDRNLIDVDDGLALSTLKSLNSFEATVGVSVGAASDIEAAISHPESAPGAAPFMSTAGILASIQTQAMIQQMIAAQLRQEAALLAHQNALLKRDVALASQIRENIKGLVTEK